MITTAHTRSRQKLTYLKEMPRLQQHLHLRTLDLMRGGVRSIEKTRQNLDRFYNWKDINYEPKQELAKITPHGVVPQNA